MLLKFLGGAQASLEGMTPHDVISFQPMGRLDQLINNGRYRNTSHWCGVTDNN